MIIELEAVAVESREYKNREGEMVKTTALVCRDLIGRGKLFTSNLWVTISEEDKVHAASLKFPVAVKISPMSFRLAGNGAMYINGSILH